MALPPALANVLVLNSGHPGRLATDAVMSGVQQEFAAQEIPPQHWVEYRDEVRFPGATHERALAQRLRRKYAQIPIDVVLTTGTPAFRFALAHRDVFGAAPIVFAGVEQASLEDLSPRDRITGVVEANGFEATLDLAFALQPRSRRIVFITPRLANRELVEPLVAHYRPGLELVFIDDESIEAIIDRVARLDRYSVVIPLAAPVAAGSNQPMRLDRFVATLAADSPAPMYAVWDYLLSKGIVGGSLVSGAAQGRQAAQLTVRLLGGAAVEAMPFAVAADALTVNHDRFERFGLDLASVPAAARVVNRPRGMLEEHLLLVTGTAAALLILTAFSLVLLASVMRRRRAEQGLIDSEEKYRQIFATESSAVVLFQVDGGRIIDANDAALALYGYRRSELLSMRATQLSAEPDKSTEFIESVRERRFGTATGRQHRRRDGATVPVDISMSMFSLKGTDTVVAVINNITARLAAERALRESEQRFRDFATAASDWYWEMDEQLRFSWFSDQYTAFTGIAQESLLGKTREEAGVPGADPEQLRQHLDDLRAHRPFRDFVHTRTRPDGTTVHVSVNGYPVFDEAGDFAGYRGTGTDVTERKRAEDELNSYRYHLEELVGARTRALEASNRDLESFSYSVSHDLRSPLRAIDGFSHVLLEDYGEQLDERAHDYLDRVRRATQRMGDIIDALLEMSRLMRAELRPREVDLSEMARAVVAQLREADAGRSVDVIIQEGLRCEGDPRLLRVVLANLFDNAWKYTAHKPHGHIEFGCRVQGDREIFFLRDNGVGFDMRYVDKLFGEFQRLHSESEFPGTGIGLATVSRVIRRHGGAVWADAKLGEGATFSFSLRPAAQTTPLAGGDLADSRSVN